ncbi:TAXI family TRAP transporter solute-binding subunit [Algihabitans albus]|uniref:TAXI family TRAP transporter solute-binding subunit n=1 Tax=Algihabitans albus TaxID=2164067 RepID=UPI001F2581D9|nr:TAXI family TRAP transporter solute-binding subunit [Algihabitans albus]
MDMRIDRRCVDGLCIDGLGLNRLRRALPKAVAAVVVAAVAFGLTGGTAGAQDQNYSLATGSVGGTYYPVGVALSTLIKVRLQPQQGINMSAINSAGSGENVRLLREGTAQLAILQGLFGFYAVEGSGPMETDGEQEHLRSVTVLWANVEHFLVERQHATTGTIADLIEMQGQPMAMGRQNSGTIGSNRMILGNLGVDMDEAYELVYLGYGPSAEALQSGDVAGMSTPAGAPVAAVTRAFAAMGDDIALLEFTPEQATEADGGTGIWSPYVIAAGTYPGLDREINTVAQPNFLAAHADVPEEDIYMITRTIYENLPFLQNIHPATQAMALETAIVGLPAPLHPGALRYLEEKGVEIPDRLRP